MQRKHTITTATAQQQTIQHHTIYHNRNTQTALGNNSTQRTKPHITQNTHTTQHHTINHKHTTQTQNDTHKHKHT